MQRRLSQFLLATALIIGIGGSRPAAQPATKPLYERLGGVYSIATVVDDFIERLLVNDTLNANPAINEARTRVPKAGLKFHVTALVCEATGGPCKYSGRSMKAAHDHLNINERQWQAMVADFRKTLDKFKVPAKEQEELIAIVGTTKEDIVAAAILASGSERSGVPAKAGIACAMPSTALRIRLNDNAAEKPGERTQVLSLGSGETERG